MARVRNDIFTSICSAGLNMANAIYSWFKDLINQSNIGPPLDDMLNKL